MGVVYSLGEGGFGCIPYSFFLDRGGDATVVYDSNVEQFRLIKEPVGAPLRGGDYVPEFDIPSAFPGVGVAGVYLPIVLPPIGGRFDSVDSILGGVDFRGVVFVRHRRWLNGQPGKFATGFLLYRKSVVLPSRLGSLVGCVGIGKNT